MNSFLQNIHDTVIIFVTYCFCGLFFGGFPLIMPSDALIRIFRFFLILEEEFPELKTNCPVRAEVMPDPLHRKQLGLAPLQVQGIECLFIQSPSYQSPM